MSINVDRAYFGWSQEELSDGDDSQEVSVSQMLDHGSISFGRFAVESLSWERRSVFTHNRRQEELEKFNGLVAKKKAYFEERYRKIRAFKASQKNQQTVLTLDYGADGSISSQTGEEDETASQLGNPRRVGNVMNAPSKEVTVEVTIEQDINYNEYLQGRSFDPESTSPDTVFSKGNSKKIEQDKIPDGALQVQPFEMESSEEVTVEAIIEQDINCNEFLQGRSINPESPSPDVAFSIGNPERIEQDKIPDGVVQVQPLETEFSLPLNEKVENIEPDQNRSLDEKELKHENIVPNAESRVITVRSALGIKDIKYSKSKPIIKSLDFKSAPSIKDSAAAIRTSRLLKQEVKAKAKGAISSSQKMMGKTESCQISSNRRIVHQVSNNTRSTLVSSNRPHTEAHSGITIPGPFTLVMERRAKSRTSAVKLDSTSSNKPASSLSPAKDDLSVQDILKKKGTIFGMKSRIGLENRRELKEATKKPLTLDSQRTSLRRTEAYMLGPKKSSSINLPARSKSNSSVATVSQLTTVKGTKLNKGKDDNRLMESQRVTVKTFGPSTTGNTKMGTNKLRPLQARPMDQFNSGRKQHFGNLSLDGRKSRRETPHWR